MAGLKIRLFLQKATDKIISCQDKVPVLREIPSNALGIIFFLLLVQCVVWAVVGVVLVRSIADTYQLLVSDIRLALSWVCQMFDAEDNTNELTLLH